MLQDLEVWDRQASIVCEYHTEVPEPTFLGWLAFVPLGSLRAGPWPTRTPQQALVLCGRRQCLPLAQALATALGIR